VALPPFTALAAGLGAGRRAVALAFAAGFAGWADFFALTALVGFFAMIARLLVLRCCSRDH
jgi:amino acid permease